MIPKCIPAAAGLLCMIFAAAATGQELSGRAKAADANGNGVIDRSEAGGPLLSNFDEMDCDKSGTLDGGEIRGFFSGAGCPQPAAAAAPANAPTPLSGRAKAADANGNGVIDRGEAGGPLLSNFDEMDCDKSGTLDGGEIRGFFSGAGCPQPTAAAAPANAPTPLSGRAKAADANGNGVIDRSEAGGPLLSNFDEMDCDKSGTLDGGEIRGFFSGAGCPQPTAASRKTASSGQSGPEASSGGRPPRSVRVDTVVTEPLSQTYPIMGRLVSLRAGDVAARINGAVAEINAEIGDRVNRGDVIATLARERLIAARNKYRAAVATRRAMVKTAQAQYARTAQELARIKNLRRSSAFSRAKFEDLERDTETRKAAIEERRSQLKEAEADLERTEIDLQDAQIRAPYDGIVSLKHTEVGAYVNTGARVVSLINDEDIEVEAEVPADRISALVAGTTVRFRLDDDTVHDATVRSVVPLENLRTRTRPVRFTPRFGDGTARLAVNQSVTVLVPVGKARQVVSVHKDAVVHRGPNRTVYLARNGKAFPRQVELGEAVGSRYVVLSGLRPGDQVVTHGNEALPPGSNIRILRDGQRTARAK